MKLKNFPLLLVLFFSLTASFLMGCSGGGGGGGGSSGEEPGDPSGYVPSELAAGFEFEFRGSSRVETGPVTYLSSVSTDLRMNSSSSGISYDGHDASSGESSITYLRAGTSLAQITAENYPYLLPSFMPTRGRVIIQLTFTSPTGGRFVETALDAVDSYTGEGTFTLSRPD